jgi:hypothetical protein
VLSREGVLSGTEHVEACQRAEHITLPKRVASSKGRARTKPYVRPERDPRAKRVVALENTPPRDECAVAEGDLGPENTVLPQDGVGSNPNVWAHLLNELDP